MKDMGPPPSGELTISWDEKAILVNHYSARQNWVSASKEFHPRSCECSERTDWVIDSIEEVKNSATMHGVPLSDTGSVLSGGVNEDDLTVVLPSGRFQCTRWDSHVDNKFSTMGIIHLLNKYRPSIYHVPAFVLLYVDTR